MEDLDSDDLTPYQQSIADTCEWAHAQGGKVLIFDGHVLITMPGQETICITCKEGTHTAT